MIVDENKSFLRGKRGFIVFLTGTLMCLGLSGYSLAKGNPIAEVISVLYWWSTVAGMWTAKMVVDKIGTKKEP